MAYTEEQKHIIKTNEKSSDNIFLPVKLPCHKNVY